MGVKRALVVAHEPDGPGGQVAVRLAERGLEVTTHIVTASYEAPNDASSFPDFADYDVVAIMGSIRSLTNKAEISSWVEDELELIRAAAEADQPVLGVCFGGQLIAEALGGSVELSPVTEIGWHTIDEVEGHTNPAGPGPWMEWHHDRIIAPSDATVLAKTESATQLFTIGKMVGTQFHPEVDYRHIEDWLETADDEYLATYGQTRDNVLVEAKANEERNNQQCHAFVDWFLDEIAGLDELGGVERSEPAHITDAGLDEPSGLERSEPAHITDAGLDEPSGLERSEPAHITDAGLDEPSGLEKTA